MIANLAKVKSVPIEQVAAHRGIKLDRHNKACCPIHSEKTPSFHINVRKQFFKCFGCGASGDSIALVMALDNCDFFRAAEIIAGIGGFDIEFDELQREKYLQKREAQRGLRETLSHALEQYRLMLGQSTIGQEYLKHRSISPEIADKFLLGYAPRDKWQFLTDMIVGSQSPEPATAIGLLREKEKGGFYDAFIDRLIFPYLNEYGEPVSLAGRTCLPEEDRKKKGIPKTLKGNNTSLFENSSYLYGLYQAEAAIKLHGCAIIVEGEMDVLSFHQAGADNTVGIGNSELKEPQCRVLKRYTDSLVFVPDHDVKENGKNPGFEMFEKNLRTALAHGFSVYIYELPPGMDPDDYAKTFEPVEEIDR